MITCQTYTEKIFIISRCNYMELHIYEQNYKVIALLLANQNQVIFRVYVYVYSCY